MQVALHRTQPMPDELTTHHKCACCGEYFTWAEARLCGIQDYMSDTHVAELRDCPHCRSTAGQLRRFLVESVGDGVWCLTLPDGSRLWTQDVSESTLRKRHPTMWQIYLQEVQIRLSYMNPQ